MDKEREGRVGHSYLGAFPQQQLFNPRHAHCISFAPDGAAFALGLGDGTVEIRLTQSGEPIAAVDAHRATASQAHFCPQLTPVLAKHLGSVGGSASLDAETSQETLKLINHLVHRSRTTMIMATHSQEVIEWVDRVLGIEDGKLIELKTSEAIQKLAS